MTGPDNRRPLASRQTGWANALARTLGRTPVTPNQISIAGMGAALLCGVCLLGAGPTNGGLARVALLLGAALFCQVRLLCNLLDGMVAIESGRRTADGGFWNEFPDRVSDLLILMGAALGLGLPALGWAAVSAAFLTAYIRELGLSCGAPADYRGPMAKPQRMALITGAALLALAEPLWQGNGQVLTAALWIIALGGGLTTMRRARSLIRHLRDTDSAT